MPQGETEDMTIHSIFNDLELSSGDSDFWLDKDAPNNITKIHINDNRTVNFQTVLNKRKLSTLWETGMSKSVISKRCLDNLHYTN